MKRFFFTAIVAVVAAGLAATVGTLSAESASFPELTPERRAQIDRRALQSEPGEAPQKIDFSAGLGHWLLAGTPLPPEQEARRATEAHKEILRSSQVVPTPPAASSVLERLLAELPERMKPPVFNYSLTVLDEPGRDSFTVGGGYLYITRPYLEALLSDEERGSDRLAFVLAHELGHVCRGHARRRWQLVTVEEELQSGRLLNVDAEWVRETLVRTVRETGTATLLAYTEKEDYRADLFGLHLCRNAGFDVENCLDVLRSRLLADDSHNTDTDNTDTDNSISPLQRLQRLRRELDGRVPGDRYGLRVFNPGTGKLQEAAGGLLEDGEPAVVFLHGMNNDLHDYHPLMHRLAREAWAGKFTILGFRYPHRGSLARSGAFLKREMQRVGGSAENVDFICHSAGGLVFRFYAEAAGGRFRRAVFQGTPHHGSDLAGLRFLLEADTLAKNLVPGLDESLDEGSGQISFDLQPGSLFLRSLNRKERDAGRYVIHRGRALRPGQAALLSTVVTTIRRNLERELRETARGDLLDRCAAGWVDRLRLPDEVTRGDLAVSLKSAALPEADRVLTFPVNHVELLDDPHVMQAAVDAILSNELPAAEGRSTRR